MGSGILNIEDIWKPMRDFSMQKEVMDRVLWRMIGCNDSFERDREAMHKVAGNRASECFVTDVMLRLRNKGHRRQNGALPIYRAITTTIVASKVDGRVYVGSKDTSTNERMVLRKISSDGNPQGWADEMTKRLKIHLQIQRAEALDDILIELEPGVRFMSPRLLVHGVPGATEFDPSQIVALNEVGVRTVSSAEQSAPRDGR